MTVFIYKKHSSEEKVIRMYLHFPGLPTLLNNNWILKRRDGGRAAQNKYELVITLPGPIETAIRSMGGVGREGPLLYGQYIG